MDKGLNKSGQLRNSILLYIFLKLLSAHFLTADGHLSRVGPKIKMLLESMEFTP